MAVVMHWFRRDLRLVDNVALNAASAAGEVLPVFVIDPGILQRPDTGVPRVAFLYAGLRALDGDLRERGSRLLLSTGEPAAVLRELARRHHVGALFFNRDYEPYATRRDARVIAALTAEGVAVHGYRDDVVAELGDLPGPRPFRVFTPFYRAWRVGATPAAAAPPQRGQFVPAGAIEGERLPRPVLASGAPLPSTPAAGHAAGRSVLDRFARQALAGYGEARDRLDRATTSRVSAFLRFGMVSIRECLAVAGRHPGPGSEAWIRQLAWRDFYRQLLAAIPRLEGEPMDQRMAGLAWNDDPAAFAAWRDGQTGYPIVDAGMRQLGSEGWLPNRARLIVASFLTKDLGLNWQLGERLFMQRLIDGDLASNNGGWQWIAGSGADPQPFFRILNPILQGQRFDPDGSYVRRWCPELAAIPQRQAHTPWLMSDAEQRQAGCVIGRDYPAPLVDHQQARTAALARVSTLKLQLQLQQPGRVLSEDLHHRLRL
ncbi:MAG: DNA photolyase family protein [Candidatus Dormibacteraeota bacterium]|nr:DNA photolyase family protein [Candidatus Dormibacteraeota bacterium]